MYRDLIWQMPTEDQPVVYLTFDDGPTPEVTEKTWDLLECFHAKATFFLVGANVEKYPEYLEKYQAKGHQIGNHSYDHLNGWNTQNEVYFESVNKASSFIPGSLFRPPYGKIKRSQTKELKSGYSIVMWSVLSGDFDPKVDADKCASNVIDNVENGSIVVLHDSKKAANVMLAALPIILRSLSEKGYVFKALPSII